MSYNFFGISRFKNSDEIYNSTWSNIDDFINVHGIENFDTYQLIEDNFIKFLKKFYDEFSTNPKEDLGISLLASHVIVDEDIRSLNNNLFYGMKKNTIEELYRIEKLNINFLENEDLTFLLRCWIRGLCNVYFIDITTGSLMRSSDEPFCFTLILHDDYEWQDIFNEFLGAYIYIDMDPYATGDYKPPIDCGKTVNA